jgi:hypothetical protein
LPPVENRKAAATDAETEQKTSPGRESPLPSAGEPALKPSAVNPPSLLNVPAPGNISENEGPPEPPDAS